MAKRTRRRRRSWSRLLLLVVFVAAALYAGYFCLFRPPEVPAETTRPDEAEEVSAEDTAQDAEALAQAAHLERKPYFYTILCPAWTTTMRQRHQYPGGRGCGERLHLWCQHPPGHQGRHQWKEPQDQLRL